MRLGLRFTITIMILGALIGGMRAAPAFGQDPSPQFVYVLVDYSMSTIPKPGAPDPYRLTLDRVVKSLGAGDRILIAKITANSMTQFQLIHEVTFPTFNLLVDAKLKYDRTMQGMRAELDRALDTAFEDRRKKGSARTDLMSSLILAGHYFSKTPPGSKKVLLILSDMVEDSTAYNFERIRLNDGDINRIIAKEKAAQRLPALNGVEVCVSGASANSTQRMLDVKRFWFAYFRESGAHMEEGHYLPLLLSLEEK